MGQQQFSMTAKADLEALFKEIDSDGNASLNLKEFRMAGPLLMDMKMIAMMQTQGKSPPADGLPQSTDEMKALFERIDADGSGSLDLEELRGFLKGSGHEYDPSFLEEIITNCDTDGNGQLDFEEFRMVLWMLEAKLGK